MISSNHFIMEGFFRINFRGLSNVLMSKNHDTYGNSVRQFLNSCTFRKPSSVRSVSTHLNQSVNGILPEGRFPGSIQQSTHLGKRKFCSQLAQSSEATLEYKESRKEQSTSEIFEEIAAGDPECLKRLKILEFEVAVLREEEHRVPDYMTKKQWEELLATKSVSLRKKYLAFYRLNELKNLSYIKKSAAEREFQERLKEEQGFHYYGLSGHSMFIRIYERNLLNLLYQRLMYQKIQNSKLEILMDCSYQEYMSSINLKLCAKQMSHCLTVVRTHKYPCSFSLFNLPKDSPLGEVLPNYSKTVFDCPITDVYSDSYLNYYPKEKLVYLSPHAKNSLKYFNHDDIYIIGAYVDKGNSVKASLAKAKEQNLRMAKLPIDEYLIWKQGTKSFPLCIVLQILLDMAYYDDWRIALKHVPRRCIQ